MLFLNFILFGFLLFVLENIFMIQCQTFLNVADNTGAKKIMCIKVLSTKSKYASLGDVIIGVVKMSINVYM